MTMPNAANNVAPHVPTLPETPPCPCWAQCVDLHSLPATLREELGLRYREYYIIVRNENCPTPDHLGHWVQLLDPNTQELSPWIPAKYFYINTAVWPN